MTPQQIRIVDLDGGYVSYEDYKRLENAVRESLETNGGVIDHADTTDGEAYVMARWDKFQTLEKLLKQ